MFTIIKCFLIYILITSEPSFGKKMHMINLDHISSSKINECQRCKVLTDSFNNWLEKTSRGKFEGGDAAWEESKLKSYARSEIRLVEVQEGLCSELSKHQDPCYAIAEEAEQALEQWWFHEDPNSADIYTWLCIENLKYCCPQKHYGENCDLCPLNKKNEVCDGHGNCNGEGTRKGNGSCVCHRGYAGKQCEDCAVNFYKHEDLCEGCDEACDGCTGRGAAACVACKSGFRLESSNCVDVNECVNHGACKTDQYCVNKQGSYKCLACDKTCQSCDGAGSKNCTSCDATLSLWSGACVDETLKSELFYDALKRVLLYLLLFCITYYVSRTSALLASVIVMAIASYIYFAEKISKMTVVDIFLNYYS